MTTAIWFLIGASLGAFFGIFLVALVSADKYAEGYRQAVEDMWRKNDKTRKRDNNNP